MESNSGVDTTEPLPGGRQCILRGRHLVVPAPWTTSRRGAGTTLAHLCSQSLYSILWRIWSHISWDCLSLQCSPPPQSRTLAIDQQWLPSSGISPACNTVLCLKIVSKTPSGALTNV